MEKVPVKQSQVCGLWELKEQLGTGGFGHVYLYQHLVSPDHVTTHIHIKASGDESLKQHYLLRCSAGMQRVLCVCVKETSEKIAVKLCRLELNSKNRERWSREIQIMKK